MKNSAYLLASTLFLASPLCWADAREPADLRHCLDLQSNYEIAKCAGELTPARRGAASSKADGAGEAAPASDAAKKEPAKQEPEKQEEPKQEVAK